MPAGWVSGMKKNFPLFHKLPLDTLRTQDILGIRYGLQTKTGDIVDTREVMPLRVFRTGKAERVSEINFAETVSPLVR